MSHASTGSPAIIMSDFAFILAAVVALVCAAYLLVRYEILDVRDAAAGAGLIAAVVFIWRMLTGKPEPVERPRDPVEPPTPDPTPPTRDVERVIAESDKTLTEEPPDDIHRRLRNEIERQRREYGDH